MTRIFYRLYGSTSSSSDMGTMAQLTILLNHGASLDPERNMKGCEDILIINLHARANATAEKLLSEKCYDKVEDSAKDMEHNNVFFDPTKRFQGMTKYTYILLRS